MKRHLALVAAVLIGFATYASANSVSYSFSTNLGSFSFTEPSLITTDGSFSITPFTLASTTFNSAFFCATPNGGSEFTFATGFLIGSCSYTRFGGSFFSALLTNATGLGTFSAVPGLSFLSPVAVQSLTVTQTSTVPEPSSLVLLGTGALGLFGALRRKLLG